MILPLLLCATLMAASPADSQSGEPRAEQLLRDALSFMAENAYLDLDVDFSLSVNTGMGAQSIQSVYSLRLEKPNRLALRLVEGQEGLSIVCDGEKTFVHLPRLDEYTVSPAKEDLSSVLMGDPEATILSGGVTSFLGLFLSGIDPDAFMIDVTDLEYVDVAPVLDAAAHRIRFKKGGSELMLWIRQEGPPHILKIEPNVSAAMDQVRKENPQAVEFDAHMQLLFRNWSTQKPETATLFTFKPPESAKKVASLGASMTRPKVESLQGKKAPDFILSRLDGSDVHLLDFLGKDVIVIDFWATWCGPCRLSMPALDELAAKFSPKGVRFFAVNLGENANTVRRYIQRYDLTLPILLDPQGRTPTLYGADGIPYTVVIGKDGTVHAEHPGFHPSMIAELAKDLETLLAQ